jgi:hypothetical protein
LKIPGSTLIWLRLEGLAALIAGVALYWHSGASWWLFVLLLLAPDLAMLFYFVSQAAGSIAYNLVHCYVLPLVLVAVALATHTNVLLPLAWIWITHIGMDRMLGYGLKYPGTFQMTHLGAIGKAAATELA